MTHSPITYTNSEVATVDQKKLEKIILKELKCQKTIVEEARELLRELSPDLGAVERFNAVLKSMKARDSFETFLDDVSKHFDDPSVSDSLDDCDKGEKIAMRIQKLAYKANKQHVRVEKARRKLMEEILDGLERMEKLGCPK